MGWQVNFYVTQKDMNELQTSISKISPRAEKLRDMDFGEDQKNQLFAGVIKAAKKSVFPHII